MMHPAKHAQQQAGLLPGKQQLFEVAQKRRAAPEGQQDMARLNRSLTAFAERIAMTEKEIRPESPQLLHKFETLLPGEFTPDAIVLLPSFQQLLRECKRLDIELRVVISHRKDVPICDDEFLFDAACLFISPDMRGKYSKSFLMILSDDVLGIEQQSCRLADVVLQSVVADSIETAQAVTVRKPLGFKPRVQGV